MREHGVCTAAAFGGVVVTFSWFHTNQLGVGLHSYGFTEGVLTALNRYYFIQFGIIGLGFIPWFRMRNGLLIAGQAEDSGGDETALLIADQAEDSDEDATA